MKTNKSYASRLKVTKHGKIIARAAGRCQSVLNELKCKIKPRVYAENQCRAPSWPDEDSFQPREMTGARSEALLGWDPSAHVWCVLL